MLEDDVLDLEEDVLEEEEETFDPQVDYSKAQLEVWADQLLLEDVNRELCPQCKASNKTNPKRYPNETPYGNETGKIEAMPQATKDGTPITDQEGNQLYLDFPEYQCEVGHRWYKGEGPRRDFKGPNTFLSKSHLDNRTRREIQNEAGVADPAFTKGRFGQPGMYNRTNPDGGRKQNTVEQRKRNGASFFGSSSPAEAWGWRLAQHEKSDKEVTKGAEMTTRKATPEELEAMPRGRMSLKGEDRRDIRQFVMPK